MSVLATKLWKDIVTTDPERVNLTLAELERNTTYAELLKMSIKELVQRQRREYQLLEESQSLSDQERAEERKRIEVYNYRENRWFHHLHQLKAERDEREVRLPAGFFNAPTNVSHFLSILTQRDT
jgi:hypothetical protein